MFFKPYLEGMGIEALDAELFNIGFWLGLEQSFYILDYNTKEMLPRRKSSSVAKYLNNKVWESLLTEKAPPYWKQLNSVVKDEPGGIQYEFNLPAAPLFSNFEAVYKVLDVALKTLHEEANKKGVLLSTVPVKTEDSIFLTDNHLTISHLDIPIINAYNNLRAHIPELLVPAANSPITDSGKSERNMLLDDLYPYPHVGPRISNYLQYKRYLDRQRPDMDKLIVTRRKLSESERKGQRNFYEMYMEEHTWNKLMKNEWNFNIPDFSFVSEEVSTPIPKPADVHIKTIGEKFAEPRIEILLPDGSTCVDDIVFNLVRVMMAAHTPKKSGLPSTLDTYLLQGRKDYSCLTGEIYDVETPEEVINAWDNLSKTSRDYLLRDPLALFFFFKEKGLLFKVNDYSLYSDRLDEWRVPQRIKTKIQNLKVGEIPANTYERIDEPVYAAFDNLDNNVSWVKR